MTQIDEENNEQDCPECEGLGFDISFTMSAVSPFDEPIPEDCSACKGTGKRGDIREMDITRPTYCNI